jgi:hypothetical protein
MSQTSDPLDPLTHQQRSLLTGSVERYSRNARAALHTILFLLKCSRFHLLAGKRFVNCPLNPD